VGETWLLGRLARSRRGRACRRLIGVVAWRPPLGGVVGAGLFFAASLTPSLLPRSWQLQGVVSGLAAAIGYGAGSGLEAVTRPVSKRAHFSGRILLVLVLLVIGAAGVLHIRWQLDVRRLMGMERGVALYLVAAALSAILVGYLLVVVSRVGRRVARTYLRFLRRFLPRAAALVFVVLTFIMFSVVTFDLLIAGRLFLGLDRAYLASNLRFDADVSRPESTFRSGGPGSLIGWEEMGRQGRTFVTQGPDIAQLEEFSGKPALVPIRVYAGLHTAETIEKRAELAAAELERAGAFERQVLVLVAPTGTGWVDPYAVDPLEYMYNGDTAAVVVQYSHRPSWMVMILNQDVSIAASRALFDAVTRRLEELPVSARPRLVVYGESIGSFGWEAIFEDLEDLRAETDGALWVGPPRMNRLWSRLIADRRPDSPLWRPVYREGEVVRFGADGAALSMVDGPWRAPRVAYLQHASDPITWLSLDLMFRRPEWLNEPRGPDVSRHVPYIPVVTFWQVVVDLVMGTNAPIGHGHKFGPAQAEAWSLILPPSGWSAEDNRRLLVVAEPDAVSVGE
jgi:uncharacterized membrane protein